MYEFANHPTDEAADEFGSRKSLFLRGRGGHPAPRRSGRDRGRGCPRPLAPNDLIEGSEAASKLGPIGGGRAGQLGRSEGRGVRSPSRLGRNENGREVRLMLRRNKRKKRQRSGKGTDREGHGPRRPWTEKGKDRKDRDRSSAGRDKGGRTRGRPLPTSRRADHARTNGIRRSPDLLWNFLIKTSTERTRRSCSGSLGGFTVSNGGMSS